MTLHRVIDIDIHISQLTGTENEDYYMQHVQTVHLIIRISRDVTVRAATKERMHAVDGCTSSHAHALIICIC